MINIMFNRESRQTGLRKKGLKIVFDIKVKTEAIKIFVTFLKKNVVERRKYKRKLLEYHKFGFFI